MAEDKVMDQSLLDLERSLKESLNPIKPDTKFIYELRQQLEVSSLHKKQQRAGISLLLIAGGLITGLVIFLIGRRFFGAKNRP
jgi:hypothetical protein